MYHILCAVKQPYHSRTGLRRTIGINDPRSENLRKKLTGCVVNLFSRWTVKFWFCQFHVIFLTVQTDTHELTFIHIKKVRFIGVDLFYDLRFRIILRHKSSS